MKKLFLKVFYLILSIGIISMFQSCQSDDTDVIPDQIIDDSEQFEELATFSLSDLSQMQKLLEAEGIVVNEDAEQAQTKGLVTNSVTVSAIKVSCKVPNPNQDGSLVDMSGVLLVPTKTFLTGLVNHRLIIAPPPTYTSNESAPSNLFDRVSLISKNGDLNFLYFFALQATSGYIVLIPDYLGFGDSFNQCVMPYIEAKPMVQSVIDLTKVAKAKLSANGYRYKKEVIVTGYSQGGFVAASLARELEENTSHNMPVSLLATGGTPCNLKQIADIARASDTLVHTFFLPYAIWGYKQNGYPQLNINDVLKEPYASQLSQVFDGTHKDVNDRFPSKMANLYTEKFIKDLDIDPSLSYINDILDENGLKPWKNRCKFVMTHGVSDVSVYYQNAKDFADEHRLSGGEVTFYPTVGEHTTAAVPYYVKASIYIALYR